MSDESKEKSVEQLYAEIAKLQQQLKQKTAYKPSLRSRTSIQELFSDAQRYRSVCVGVCGWIRTSRTAGGGSFCFLKITDGSCAHELQIIVNGSVPGFDLVSKAARDKSVFVVGEIVPSKGKQQAIELVASEVELLGDCDVDAYPLSGKAHSLEFLRQNAHLRIRTKTYASVFRIRHALAFATHDYFNKNGFFNVQTPLITASDCEGGGEMFRVTTLERKEIQDVDKDFFKTSSYLSVSGQLNAECLALGMSKVYTFGPTFRAENSNTSRHLAEFWMIEPEIAFADLDDDMDIAEGYLKHCINYCLDKYDADLAILEEREIKAMAEEKAAAKKANKGGGGGGGKKKQQKKQKKQEQQQQGKDDSKDKGEQQGKEKELEEKQEKPKPKIPTEEEKAALRAKKQAEKEKKKKQKKQKPVKSWRETPLRQRLQQIAAGSFARVTYREAIKILQDAVANEVVEFEEADIKFGMDLGSEHERYLCERHFVKPTFITDYPKSIKAFYMRENEDRETCRAMDCVAPGIGEIIGGSQREERLDVLLRVMKEKGLDEEDYSWYLDLRRFGSVPHSGFGLGFERLVCYVTGMTNVRDVIPFPRTPGNCSF